MIKTDYSKQTSITSKQANLVTTIRKHAKKGAELGNPSQICQTAICVSTEHTNFHSVAAKALNALFGEEQGAYTQDTINKS